MGKKELYQSLVEVGWSGSDAKIYLTLLEIGPQLASALGRQLRRPRVTIYHALECMSEKGFVIKNRTGNGWQYAAVSPKRLRQIAEDRSIEIQKKSAELVQHLVWLQPSLESLQRQTFSRPHVEVFEGDDALRNMYDLSLETKSMVAYYDPWSPERQEFQEIDDEHTRRRILSGIPVRIILPDTKEGVAFAKIQKPLKEVIVVPAHRFPFKDITIITDTRVLVFSLHDRMGVSIESENIARNQKLQFELAWEGAKSIAARLALSRPGWPR